MSYKIKISSFTVALAFTLVLGFSNATPATALSGSEFKAGRIIDDALFYDGETMTASQIQNFLNSKVSTCDTNGTQMYNSTQTRAQYGASRGYPAPYTCLKSHKQDTGYKAGQSGLCSAIEAKTNRSAAQIIDDVARACHISQKALIVMLQKEQGLITDDWPWSIQYRSAMGYGCPDTAACDSQYYGFFNQVYNAALQFQRYKADPTYWNHVPFMTNQVLYQANAPSCGSRSVYIENYATAGLYNYTPYTPNTAALNNLYGTGDSCSAYGNRNFWRYFNDWFGSTRAGAYQSSYVGQSANPTISPDGTATVWITFRNNGVASWHTNGTTPVRLATTEPINRSSDFYDPSWGSGNRPAVHFDTVYKTDGSAYTTTPTEVKPGESVRFMFKLKVPAKKVSGTYREYFNLVHEAGTGLIPSSPSKIWVDINVSREPSTSFVTQSPYPSLRAGESKPISITFKNTGNTIWYDNKTAGSNSTKPTRLATMNPVNRSSIFGDSNWGSGKNRPTGVFDVVYKDNGEAYSSNPHVVKPGESAKFKFTVTAPDNYTPGSYREHYSLVEDGGSGVVPISLVPWIDVAVVNAPTAKPATASYSERIVQSTSLSRTYSFKNTGTTTWDSTTQLRVVSGSTDGIRSDNWLSDTVATTINENSVAPGQTGSFTVVYKATGALGSRIIQLAPFIAGSSISLENVTSKISIEEIDYTAKYYTQANYPTMRQNSVQETFFSFKNTGNVPWYDVTTSGAAGVRPVVLASTDPINRTSKFNSSFDTRNRAATKFSRVLEADGTTLATNQHIAQPGQIVEFRFTLTAPNNLKPGTYREMFQPIVEGGNPWSMKQIVWTDIKVVDASHVAKFYGQSAFPTINRGSSANSYFKFKNTGNSTWFDTSSAPRGIRPVTLAATDPINRLSVFREGFDTENRASVSFASVYEPDGTTLTSDQHLVKPGQIAQFNLTFDAPLDMKPGTYRETFQPIVEGGSPWSMQQVVWLYVTVN